MKLYSEKNKRAYIKYPYPTLTPECRDSSLAPREWLVSFLRLHTVSEILHVRRVSYTNIVYYYTYQKSLHLLSIQAIIYSASLLTLYIHYLHLYHTIYTLYTLVKTIRV